jgi:hypothetical protein
MFKSIDQLRLHIEKHAPVGSVSTIYERLESGESAAQNITGFSTLFNESALAIEVDDESKVVVLTEENLSSLQVLGEDGREIRFTDDNGSKYTLVLNCVVVEDWAD